MMYTSNAFAHDLLLVQQLVSLLLRKDHCTAHFLQSLITVSNLSRNQSHVVATQLYAMLHDVLDDSCLQWLADSLYRRVGVVAQSHRKSSMYAVKRILCIQNLMNWNNDVLEDHEVLCQIVILVKVCDVTFHLCLVRTWTVGTPKL